MTLQSDFLITETETISPKECMNIVSFGKIGKICSLSRIRSNKQVLVYEVLESTNDFKSIFVGYIHLKKFMKFQKFIEILSLLHDQIQHQEIRFLLIIFISNNHIKKGKYEII